MFFISYRNWLNEKFTEEGDPIQDMGIGLIRKIKKWISDFENENGNYWVKGLKINDDLTLDAYNCNIAWPRYNVLPSYIKFNYIERDFDCCFDNLETIKLNGPKKVSGEYGIYNIGFRKPMNFFKRDIRKVCDVKFKNIIFHY